MTNHHLVDISKSAKTNPPVKTWTSYTVDNSKSANHTVDNSKPTKRIVDNSESTTHRVDHPTSTLKQNINHKVNKTPNTTSTNRTVDSSEFTDQKRRLQQRHTVGNPNPTNQAANNSKLTNHRWLEWSVKYSLAVVSRNSS